MKVAAQEIAALTLTTMINNPGLIQQAELDILLASDSVSLNDYFKKSKIIDDSMPKGIEYTWEKLKIEDRETYDHEIEHKKIADKYGITSKVFKINDKVHYVSIIDLEEVAKKNKYDAQKIIDISKEGLMAPHINKKHISTADKLDILTYEILNGNIKKIHIKELTKAFEKYSWERK